MDRKIVVQSVIMKKGAKKYLEVGVHGGACFFSINIKSKTAVDPAFLFNGIKKLKHKIKSFPGKVKFHSLESDTFFKTKADEKYDVIFLDGLHTYDQTYRDVINSLKYLEDDGIILLHDCNPTNAQSAEPASSIYEMKKQYAGEWNREWNGDVWKVIVKLRSLHPELNVSVLDCDFGIGIVQRAKPENTLKYSDADIKAMTYDILAANRKELLNLKPVEYFPTFLNSLS